MHRRIGLRRVLAALVLVIVAPLGLLAAISVQRAWRRQLANVDRQNVATVRAISVAVDQHLEKTTAALDVLGELHALDAPDIPAFESLAARLLPYQPNWSAILLADPSGRVVDGVPDSFDGSARAAGDHWARATAAARKTTVSNLFELPGSSNHFVIVATPVIRQGRVTSVLAARVEARSFSALLRDQQTPPNGAVAIIDSAHRVIARKPDDPELVGALATPSFIESSSRTSESAFRATMREGQAAYAALSRSARSGLTVGLGQPAEDVDGPIRRILLMLAGAWAVVLVLGAGLGLILGHVIVRALRGASKAALGLARGEAVAPRRSHLLEIDDLAVALEGAGETLRARNRERDEASRLKDEFLMTISHELRTPLTAICGWARMMAAGQVRDGQRDRAIEAIERNAQALQQLVDDLLDVSRIVTGKLRLDVQPVNVSELIASAVEAVRPAADAKNIQVAIALDPAIGALAADASRLQQVLWNLLSNAVKFTPAGGRIDVSCRQVRDHIELVVRDTGVGIEPEFLPHVFERFRQGAGGTTRSHGGLGLGLAIVRHLAELHGGTVTAENNVPPPGATFRVNLPMVAITDSDASGWSPREAVGTPTPATPPTIAAH